MLVLLLAQAHARCYLPAWLRADMASDVSWPPVRRRARRRWTTSAWWRPPNRSLEQTGDLRIAHATHALLFDSSAAQCERSADLLAGMIKANKEFDMLMIPNSAHGYTPATYVTRRRWDYFVKYLLDAKRPWDCVIPSVPAKGRGGRGGN